MLGVCGSCLHLHVKLILFGYSISDRENTSQYQNVSNLMELDDLAEEFIVWKGFLK